MQIPPFPKDVPIVPIAVISNANIEAEAPKIYEACRTDGFFYLDLTGHPLAALAEKLRDLAVDAFNHPIEDKMRYHLVKGQGLAGYKAAGTQKLTDSTLRPDSTEFFNIYTDHLHNFATSRTYPPYFRDDDGGNSVWTILRTFSQAAHALCLNILSLLARQLSVPDTAFSSRNTFGNPSGSHIRLTHKPPNPPELGTSIIGLPSHTDFGSITLLFTWLGGLQIQHPHDSPTSEWKYIRSLPDHAIINLGDAMVRFTDGALKSAKHRVVEASGDQSRLDRYSVVYFVRPSNDVPMVPLEQFSGEPDENEQLDGKKERKGRKKVAGKFEADGSKVLTAENWIKERQIQLGN